MKGKMDMVENFKKMFRMSLISSVFFIVVGLFLILKPEVTLATISYVIGGIIIVIGVTFLIKYFSNKEYGMFSGDLIFGVMSVIFGFILILNPTALAKIIPFILGIWIVISSITKIQYSLQLKTYNNKAWVSTMMIAAITFLWGLLLLFDPFEGAMVITQVIGMFILIYAVLDLAEVILIKKNLKDIKKGVGKIIE